MQIEAFAVNDVTVEILVGVAAGQLAVIGLGKALLAQLATNDDAILCEREKSSPTSHRPCSSSEALK